MKKVTLLFSIVFIGFWFIQCSSTDEALQPLIENSIADIQRNNVLDLKLDQKFSIPEKEYVEFIESLTFDENGNFRGAIYTEVEKHMDDNSSNEFWGNFGFTLRSKDKDLSIIETNQVWEGYRPKVQGCKRNRRWLCVIEME